jgi:hygromycin-B 4-O-kinase
MKYNKPNIKISTINSIIRNVFNNHCTNLEEISGGQIARSYKFNIEAKGFYIQINQQNMSQGARTELERYNQFKDLGIPVRNIVRQEYYDDIHFVITEEVHGVALESLSENEVKELFPLIIEAAISISNVDISNANGYGWLNEDGNGMSPSWKTHINSVNEEESEELFYGKWHKLFDDTFLDKKAFDHYFSKLIKLNSSLPEDRYFQHGNFSLANILVHEKELQAIIDWQDARYGDFLYDLAYLSFWLSPSLNDFLIEIAKPYFETAYGPIENYYKRINSYKYFIGLDSLRFFAKSDQKAGYDYTRAILDKIY